MRATLSSHFPLVFYYEKLQTCIKAQRLQPWTSVCPSPFDGNISLYLLYPLSICLVIPLDIHQVILFFWCSWNYIADVSTFSLKHFIMHVISWRPVFISNIILMTENGYTLNGIALQSTVCLLRLITSMLWDLLVLCLDLQSFPKASLIKIWRPAVLRNCGNFRVKVKSERSSDYWRHGFENGSSISPKLFFLILIWNEWLYFLPCLGQNYNRTNESWTNELWNNSPGTFETLHKNKYFLWTGWLFQVFICTVPESYRT